MLGIFSELYYKHCQNRPQRKYVWAPGQLVNSAISLTCPKWPSLSYAPESQCASILKESCKFGLKIWQITIKLFQYVYIYFPLAKWQQSFSEYFIFGNINIFRLATWNNLNTSLASYLILISSLDFFTPNLLVRTQEINFAYSFLLRSVLLII